MIGIIPRLSGRVMSGVVALLASLAAESPARAITTAEPAHGARYIARLDDPSQFWLRTRYGAAITLGLGATDFLSDGARNLTGTGFYGDLRLTYGTRSWFGIEGGYTFSARGLSNAAFGPDSPQLFGNGLEGLARFNLPRHKGELFYGPFVVAGLGWTAYVRTDETGGDLSMRGTDHVGTVPIGGGIAVAYRRIYGEARFMYRATYGGDGMIAADGRGRNLQSWSAGISGGVEF